jgi:pyruvate dehydrogenase E2 component (dihydrolipoamide acetyltransferase)
MAEVVKMPKMSDTMTEGVMAKWHKKVGDKVKSGDVLAEVETDKATMDLESYWDGVMLYIGVEEGKAVPVDAVIAVIGKEGEDYKAALDAEGTAAPAKEEAPAEKPAEEKSSDTNETPKGETAGAALSDADLEKAGVTVVRMPLLSDTMTEGVIAEWHKKVGDVVKNDDILADVETDKATMEVMGYADGTLLHIGVEKGAAAKVNGIIAIVGPAGFDISGILSQGDAPAKPVADKNADAPVKEADAPTAESKSEESAEPATTEGSRLKASPLAKKIAKDKGIDLSQVSGSADGGRIIKKDIENFKPAAAPAKAAEGSAPAEKAAPVLAAYIGEEKFSEKPVSQMRKVIAKRLSESLFTAPHFYLTMSIDMDAAIAARGKMNEFSPVKLSFNDLVVKAVAVALKQHPNVNSSWRGDVIRYNEHVNIGVAIAVEDGLLVPVVRFADGKSLSRISAEVKDFAQRAKAKKLQPSDWEGSTFTVSNLGMFGIDEFTAIINTPDSCILAIGGISQVPVVKNGAVVPGNVMKVTLSCDHRTVDGATGAAFLQTFKALMEEPVRLLV